ncbi:hypothetical protein Q8A67_013475 [Cirrhinus molitorella]|uniref:Uncharacterized protein n=1 Tax=Cirrhinus molitorella TaxID=172907 RepID=A0AA88TNG2_9TELE|nr:hypothetical protein Q8A67_013475 [Cirrhinus molitorella]
MPVGQEVDVGGVKLPKAHGPSGYDHPFHPLPITANTAVYVTAVCVCVGWARGCREACWSVSSAGVPGLAPGVHTRANEREKSRRDTGRAAKLNELRLCFGINISIKR